MRRATKIPAWAPQDTARWPAGCTPHRDGWVRWYKGATRFVCGKGTPLAKVEDRWMDKKRELDGAVVTIDVSPAAPLYRVVLSEFLADCEHRVKTGQPRPMEQRTLENYTDDLNAFGAFVWQGQKTADYPIGEITPATFTAYARLFGNWKASGFDSIVTRIGALFRWAVEMDYLDRYRPGPMFQRPTKRAIRDDRIDLSKRFEPAEVAKLYLAGNHTLRCWIGLGASAAFINTDIAHVPRQCIDLAAGLVDFRRRKTGKVRRVIPLPQRVAEDLRAYRRPEPTDPRHADLFFITERGRPYDTCSTSITRLFRKLMVAADVELKGGRNFTGLRTTFYNLAPRSAEYEVERKIIMGRARGTIDLDHYLEDVGLDRLRHVVDHVWEPISTELKDAERRQARADASASAAGARPAAT